ncbi:ankyrin repeat-containing domain protein [Boletus reticuloceps]|uniref:Ankyrin repeat-containing domain protein n=1 Tax=Boletus reticuloceps TaxID=495285 RepID=A0A8I2YCK0_9AGAM|nr:ankyrin repeat-containing domain protein [Boletus reticuloceps]
MGNEGNYEGDLLAIVQRFNQAVDDKLLHGHNLNMLLPFAVERGHIHLTRYLFPVRPSLPSGLFETLGDWKTSVHAPMVSGAPVLHTALWSFQNEHLALETVKLLVSLGYDPLETTSSGKKLLHIAGERGFTTVIRYLQALSLGNSPPLNLLHIALRITGEEDKARMIAFLLENGANVHACKAVSGDSVLHTTLQSFQNEYFALETVKIFVGRGCDPLKANSSGKTPLCIAIEAGFVSVAQFFLSLGASLPPNMLDTLNRWDGWENVSMFNFSSGMESMHGPQLGSLCSISYCGRPGVKAVLWSL